MTNTTRGRLAGKAAIVTGAASSTQCSQWTSRVSSCAYGVLYLASDEADWVTGVNFAIDGGHTAR